MMQAPVDARVSVNADPEAGSAPGDRRVDVAYLVNQYPKVSHTFIRREIQALERQGVRVHRFAIRGWDAEVADDADRQEKARTRYVLERGLLPLAGALVAAMLRAPRMFARSLALAFKTARRSYRSLPYHLVYLAEAAWLLACLRGTDVVHLHAHFGTNAADVAMLVHELGGPPYSFTVHGPEEFDRPEALGLRAKIERAMFVVAISSFGRSQLYRWIDPTQWAKVQVVHCGLDADFHSAPTDDPPTAARLVCVGRLCEQKGQLLLLHAMKIVVHRGLPFELVLAGDGEMRPAIESLIDELGLRRHVRITGWIDSARVREELVAARALVLPSFAEGLPVVIMESMALQRPVVSTFVGGIAELVRPGQDGWLVPAGEVDALADALQACLEASGSTLARMGRNARERVAIHHSVHVEAAKLARLFSESARSAIATQT